MPLYLFSVSQREKKTGLGKGNVLVVKKLAGAEIIASETLIREYQTTALVDVRDKSHAYSL